MSNLTQREAELADYDKFREKLFNTIPLVNTPTLLWENNPKKDIVIKFRNFFDNKPIVSNNVIVTGIS